MKKLLTLTAMFAGLTLVVGCNEQAPTGGQTDDGKITILFDSQFGSDMEGRLRAFTEAFNKSQDEITVVYNKISGDYNGIFTHERTEINSATNLQGDIVTCYPDHIPDYINLGKAVKLDKFINDPEVGLSEAQMKNYVKPAQDEFETVYPRPGIFTMPWAVSTEALYFNEDILGIQIEGINGNNPIDLDYLNSLTWEEIFGTTDNPGFAQKVLDYNDGLAANEKILDTSKSTYSVFGYSSDDNLFITMLEQYGYDYTSVNNTTHIGSFDFNNANVKGLMKKLRQYKQSHYLITNGSNNDSTITDLMGSKQLLFCIASTGGSTYQVKAAEKAGFTMGVARLPQAAGKENKLISQGGSFCILSHTGEDNEARQLAAWKFYKYLLSVSNCAIWATQTGYAPLLESVKSSEAWLGYIKTEGKTGSPLLKAKIATYFSTYADYLFTSPVFKGSSEARVQAGGVVKQILSEDSLSDEDIDTIFEDAINNCKLAQK